jgi:hypothetical protein
MLRYAAELLPLWWVTVALLQLLLLQQQMLQASAAAKRSAAVKCIHAKGGKSPTGAAALHVIKSRLYSCLSGLLGGCKGSAMLCGAPAGTLPATQPTGRTDVDLKGTVALQPPCRNTSAQG